ncbi:hypothetical protein M9Y10_035898 [Tritrichomonas musculus]|uniref:Transmembrane protein n=1 Tax=Tritrichomonas musculus TaxID=1915356 RepID=A0ABR2GVJ9_9EUKA
MIFFSDELVNKIKFNFDKVFHQIMNTMLFKIYDTSMAFPKNNNIQILDVAEVIKNIDSYSKTTGIMINEIKVTDDNKLLLLIFDYKIIIINETDLIFFKVFFDRIKGQTTLFFKNAQFKDKFEEMLRKGQNDQKQIQISNKLFSKNSKENYQTDYPKKSIKNNQSQI